MIQETWQRGRIADVVLGEIRANDLPADKIKTEVPLAQIVPFAFGFMLLLSPATRTENLQTGTVHDQLHRFSFLEFGIVRKDSPLRRRDRLEKSGFAISPSSSLAMERIKP